MKVKKIEASNIMIDNYIYEFKPKCHVILTQWELEDIKTSLEKGKDPFKAWIGHGYTQARITLQDPATIRFHFYDKYCGEVNDLLSIEALNSEYDPGKIYVLKNGSLYPIEIRSHKYYKLLPTKPNGWPSLEISGIHMHRIWGTDPKQDTYIKLKAAKIGPKHVVLDTCMGLGYTAIGSFLKGAVKIYTVEIDSNVINIASYNPWSWALSENNIKILHGDVISIIKYFPDEFFDRIIHDPPRLSSETGDLYGEYFYKELFRVLKKRGVLYHYTGNPGKKRGGRFPNRVMGRLKKAGFSRVFSVVDKALGVVAIK